MKTSTSFLLIVSFVFLAGSSKAQDLLNPYAVSEYQNLELIDWKYKSDNSTFEYLFEKSTTGQYNGEYRVTLRDHFWNFSGIPFLQGKAKSLQMEVISFPVVHINVDLEI